MTEQSGPPQRKRLVLKPRTKPVGASAAPSRNSSIFGSARTREEILAAKGIDYKKVDAQLDERTAKLPRMSEKEEEEMKALESEIAFAKSEVESAGVDASEEDKKKLEDAVKAKEAELKTFIDAIRKKGMTSKDGGRPKFERPSERRARQEAARRERGGSGDYHNDRDGDFSNFGSNRNRGGSNDYGRDDAAFSNFGGGRGRRNGGGNGGGRNHESRPGDWTCGACGANVFAAKDNCYRCGAPRSEGAEVSYDSRDSRSNSYGGGGGGRSNSYGGGGRDHRQQEPRQRYDHIDRMLEGDDTVGEAW